jgi:Tfp pilus assembly protein PilF
MKSAISNDPINATRYKLEMAESYLKLANYKKALLSCDDILRLQPNNSGAILISAEINQASGNYTDAKRDFDRAAELAPKDPEVFEKRGTFFLMTRQFGAAVQDLKKALNIAPSFPGVKLKLASCIKQVSLVHGREFEIDRTKLSNAELKEIGAADASTLKSLGYAALEKSKITYAVAALTRAVMLMPNDPMARHYLAYALLAAHEYDAAITQFYAWGKLEAISDDDEIAFATSIANEGETDKAKLLIGRLTTQFSKSSTSLIKLANLCLKQKFNILGLEVVSAGLKIASSEEKVEFDRLSTEFDHVNDAPKTNQDISPIGKS